MNALSDPQLLRAYADRRSEAAFAELVRRHIDLVHSAALRMVNDPHLAKDVAQGVFVALAKDAGKLTAHPVLSGWLHRTARNIAAQTIRTEVRRRHREQEVAAMNEHPETDAAWEEIAPHLDAALAELTEPDRDAVLLRYFENKPAQEMAAILGVSAEAAQKRVSRAVEKLRENFAKRGIVAGAAGLTGIISANAVQAAPAGLAASISTAALAGTAVATSITAMTATGKAIIAAAITVLGGVGIYYAHQTSQLRHRVRTLELIQESLIAQDLKPRQTTHQTSTDSPQHLAGSQQVTANSEAAGNKSWKSNPSAKKYIGSEGTSLTSTLMPDFGLSREQFVKTQGVVTSHWTMMAAWAAKNIFCDEIASKVAADGANIFRLPAMDPSERQAILDQFSQDLRTASNDAAAGAIETNLADNRSFAYMGKYDVVFRFTQLKAQNWDTKTNSVIGEAVVISNDASVAYSFINPKNGHVELDSRGSDLSETNEVFGNIFQLDK